MITESSVRAVLEPNFDDYGLHDRVRVGERNTVYAVTVDGRKAACKMTERQPGRLAREGAILRAVGERTPVSVPTVIRMGDGYLLLKWVDGERLDSDAVRPGWQEKLQSVGRYLAQLHRSTEGWFAGHGPLEEEVEDGRLAVDRDDDWPDRFGSFVDEWAEELRGTQYADVGRAVGTALETHRDAFADRTPVLVHGEPSPDHVLFDGRDVHTLIDWEVSQAAPGAFDLVWAERDLLGRPVGREDYGPLREALVDGYCRHRQLNPEFWFHREVYRAAFAMRELTIVTDPDMPPQSERGDYGELLWHYVQERLEDALSIAPTANE